MSAFPQTEMDKMFSECKNLKSYPTVDTQADDHGELHFQVDGETMILSPKELKRIKELLMDKFPEDYL